jgi:hypothetical protein
MEGKEGHEGKEEAKEKKIEKEKADSPVDVRVCREQPMNAIDADCANVTTGSAAVTSRISQNIR